ncbi:MAG: hypothetical protein WA005_18465, partial [Candidatus Binataceae bacterium]
TQTAPAVMANADQQRGIAAALDSILRNFQNLYYPSPSLNRVLETAPGVQEKTAARGLDYR